MTPTKDQTIRVRAEHIYQWAEKELKETEIPYPAHVLGQDIEEWKAQLDQREKNMQYLREYRSWLYDVRSFAEHRRRHPLVQLLRKSQHIGRIDQLYTDSEWQSIQAKIGDGPLRMSREREPAWWFHWWWTDDTADFTQRKDTARAFSFGGDTIGGLGLPDFTRSGRAWFYIYMDKLQWDINWGLFTHERGFSLGVDISGEDGDVVSHIRIPFLGFFFLSFKKVIPVKWLPQHRSVYTTYEPHVFASAEEHEHEQAIQEGRIKPVKHEFVQGMDINLSVSIAGDHISWEIFNVSEHMQCGNGRRGYIFWMDKVFGRFDCTVEQEGPEVEAVACFPEGKYTLKLQRERRVWKRSRWPWAYWQKYVDIDAVTAPEFQGKGENSWDLGPDAIRGMSSRGWSYEDAVGEYVKATLRERRRRGTLAPEHKTILTEVREYV